MLSQTIRWSYPALSNEQLRWQQAAAQLAPPELARQVAAQEFAAIVVDRFGYEDDGAKIIAALQSATGVDAILVQSDRYVALDIRALAAAGKSSPMEFLAPPVAASVALAACGDPSVAFIDQIGLATWPFTEQPVRIRASDGLRVGGWAVDLPGAAAAAAVDVSLDQHQFPSVYGIDRSDVAEYLKKQVYTPSGFVVQLPPDVLSQGTHTLSIRVVASDRRCYYNGPTVPIFIE